MIFEPAQNGIIGHFQRIFRGGSPAREARVGQSPILIEYGQPLFFWLSRDWPSVRTYVRTRLQIVRVG